MTEIHDPDPNTHEPDLPQVPARFAPRPVPAEGRWVGPDTERARYRLQDRVAAGAEGELWRANYVGRDGAPGEMVAVKVYRRPSSAGPHWPDDGTWLQVQDQHRLLSLAGHTAHVVRVHEVLRAVVTVDGVGEPGVSPVVVMDWVEGSPPTPRRDGAPVPLRTRLRWIAELAEAVDVLHAASRHDRVPLVHADIKPANCLVDPTHGLVLVDTGAVQRAGGLGDHRGLRSEQYAAPEVLAGPGRARTEAADLYSVGAVAFFLLVGSLPPRADRPGYVDEIRAAVAEWSQVSRRRRATVADHLAAMMASDPAVRPTGGAAAWARELTGLLSRRRGLAAGTAVAAVGTAAALVVALLPGAEPDPGLLYSAFPAESDDWTAQRTAGFTTDWTDTGYRLDVTSHGAYEVVPAPPTPAPNDQIVEATAVRLAGQGAWGVWCRGTDAAGTARYSFQLSHAGAVRIMLPDDRATEWTYVEGLDTSAPVTLTARCADVPGVPVELTLLVNGVEQQVVHPDIVLGPGYSGVEGMTFSDVPGALSAEYRSFQVRRGEGST